jgi:glycosyltransferase involved in cell wall biosynthesis
MDRRQIQILRVITRLNIGGPGLHVLTLTRALTEYPTLVACGRPDPHEGLLDSSGIETTSVPLVRPVAPISDLQAVRDLRRLILRRHPSIVESHMAKAGFAARIAAVASRPRPATVHVFHGHVFDGYFSQPVQSALIRVERLLARRTDLLLTVSDQIRDDLLALDIGQEDQYRVVPLGLQLGPFLARQGPSGTLRQPLGLSADTPLIGVAARLVPIKDHQTLFSALSRVPDAHLAVLGDGVLGPDLKEWARASEVGPRIHFLGWHEDMAAALADCDVVALSSRNEGTPVCLIEAMAAGKPVVATDVGGTPSVVDDGETGFLVPPHDPVALAERLETVLSDRELARRLGGQGRIVAQERFGLDRLVSDMRSLYSELLGRRPA